MSRDYQKLLEGVYDNSEKKTAVVERELASVYRSAYDELSNALASLYKKMGDQPSIQEAKRYNRLTALKAEISKAYKLLTKADIKATEANGIRAFTDLAYGTEWAIDQATGIELKWGVLPVGAIRSSVMNDVAGETFQERFKNWSVKDQIRINQSIGAGLTLGEPYAKVARRIKDSIQASYDQAIRIVRTEATRDQTLGHLETYETAQELGVVMDKTWIATLDERTRVSHGELDGQIADEQGLFWIGSDSAEGPGLFSLPENSISCRCRVVEVIKDLSPELRRSREDGLIPYTTFTEWAGKRGWTPKNGWPIEKRI